MLRIARDYPDAEAERRLLTGEDRAAMVGRLAPRLDGTDILALRQHARTVVASPTLLDYVQALVAAARAWAWLGDRDYALPEDVQAVFVAVAGHRLIPARTLARDALAQALLESVAVEGRHGWRRAARASRPCGARTTLV